MALTRTESDILLLSDGGFSNREIARDLDLSPRYVGGIVRYYAVSFGEDRRRDDKIRAGSQKLAKAMAAERRVG